MLIENPLNIASFIVIAVFSFTQLQPPAPRPRENSQGKQHEGRGESAKGNAQNRTSQSPSPSISQGQGAFNGDENTGDRNKGNDGSSNDWNRVVVIATVAMVLVAIVQAVIYFFQACYMRKGLAHTQAMIEQMRLEQRAWLGVAVKIGELVPSQPIEVILEVKNFGKTPGNIESIIMGVYVYSLPVDFDDIIQSHTKESRANVQENVVPPEATTECYLPDQFSLLEDQITRVNDGALKIVLLATVCYSDVMGAKRETRGCFIYNARAKTMSEHDQHNYMR